MKDLRRPQGLASRYRIRPAQHIRSATMEAGSRKDWLIVPPPGITNQMQSEDICRVKYTTALGKNLAQMNASSN